MYTAGPSVGSIFALILLVGVVGFVVVFIVIRARRQPPSNPPGWYPDPYGQAAQRYWDGGRWTGHTA